MKKRAAILLATFVLVMGMVFQPFVAVAASGTPASDGDPGTQAVFAMDDPGGTGGAGDTGGLPDDLASADADPAGALTDELATSADDTSLLEEAYDAAEPEAEPGESAEEEADGNADGFEVDGDAEDPTPEKATSAKLRAPALRAVHNDVITSIDAQLQDGTGPVGNIGQWQVFRLYATFALPNGQVHEGDTTTITLPEKLKFNQTASFQVTKTVGDETIVVANGVINGAAKTITLTYTDFPETHSDVDGNFYFYVQMDRDKVDGAEDITLEFDVDGKTFIGPTIHFDGIPDPHPSYISKSGWQRDNRRIEYQLKVNTRGEAIQGLEVSDELRTAGVTIDKSSMTIEKGTWVAVHGDWELHNKTDVTSNYIDRVAWTSDSSFTINFGDIAASDGFVVKYKGISSYDFVDGEVILNNVSVNGSMGNYGPFEVMTTYMEAGGSADGYVYTIKIKKEAEGSSDALAGAVFNVVRVANGAVVDTVTTDANGEATVTGLLKDTYELVEVSPPAGYVASTGPITITPADFNSEKIAFQTVKNALEETSITVTKSWVGPVAGPVTVRLTADGQETGRAAVLSDENGWRHTFSGLAKYNADGSAIAYRVQEDGVEGYEPEVIEGDDGSFTIVNRNIETVDIPVQKSWVGPVAGPVIVRLTADGREAGKAVLSDENGWRHTFSGLAKYNADGSAIAYRVQEDGVEGYEPEVIEGDDGSFTIVNRNIETVDIAGTKAWDDNDNQDGVRPESITVRLLANGDEIDSMAVTADEDWSWTFTDLPKYDTDGVLITYTITEDAVSDYSTTYEGYNVINAHTPGKTSLTVVKAWNDVDNKDGSRPESVSVRLLADGVETGAVLVLNEANNWTGTFEGLDEFADGRAIVYTVAEDEVKGYTSEITGDAEKGYVVTNSHTPEEPPATPQKPPRTREATPPAKATTPKTGDTVPFGVVAGLVGVTVIASVVVLLSGRKSGPFKGKGGHE